MPPRFPVFSLFAFGSVRPPPPSRLALRLPWRPASQYPFNRGRRPSYNRFNRAQQVRNLWQTSIYFRGGVLVLGAGGGIFYVSNLEKVPVSGRRRFNCVSEKTEKALSESAFRQAMQQYGRQILLPSHPDSLMVERVMKRLIPASGLGSEGWEVRVIGDKSVQNAFVLPGGKVFVFSGILPVCKDEEGLAAVLGHEIAHNQAHHHAEKMSQVYLLYLAIYGTSLLFGIDPGLPAFLLNYAVSLPGSRKQEIEADQLGLLMMAKSCYDPRKAVEFWQRMAKAEQYAPPQFVSTHPSSQTRIRTIEGWIPAAEQARQNSECGMTGEFMQNFKDTLGRFPAIEEQRTYGTGSNDNDDFF